MHLSNTRQLPSAGRSVIPCYSAAKKINPQILAENHHFCHVHEQNVDFALLTATDPGMCLISAVVRVPQASRFVCSCDLALLRNRRPNTEVVSRTGWAAVKSTDLRKSTTRGESRDGGAGGQRRRRSRRELHVRVAVVVVVVQLSVPTCCDLGQFLFSSLRN